jgi:hypothetical protein
MRSKLCSQFDPVIMPPVHSWFWFVFRDAPGFVPSSVRSLLVRFVPDYVSTYDPDNIPSYLSGCVPGYVLSDVPSHVPIHCRIRFVPDHFPAHVPDDVPCSPPLLIPGGVNCYAPIHVPNSSPLFNPWCVPG